MEPVSLLTIAGIILGPTGVVAGIVAIFHARAQMQKLNASIDLDRENQRLARDTFRLQVERMQMEERAKFMEQLQLELRDVRTQLAECHSGRRSDQEIMRKLDERQYQLVMQLADMKVAHALATPPPGSTTTTTTTTAQTPEPTKTEA